MKTTVWLFVSSCAFGAIIAGVYYATAHEATGTILLGIMAFAFLFLLCYTRWSERSADLAGDRADMRMRDAAGEPIGIVTPRSMWPPILALAVLMTLYGVVSATALSAIGVAVMLVALWRLVAESA